MTPCPLCNQPVAIGVDDVASIRFNGLLAHRECALRSVLGGIGHLTDCGLWCARNGDPDMGLSYRESALAVDAWVAERGIREAISRTVHH